MQQVSVYAVADPHGKRWVEASESAESLEDAAGIIKQWVDAGEIEHLKSPDQVVHFIIEVRS